MFFKKAPEKTITKTPEQHLWWVAFLLIGLLWKKCSFTVLLPRDIDCFHYQQKAVIIFLITFTAWKTSQYGGFYDLYLVRIQENTDPKNLHIRALFTQWLTIKNLILKGDLTKSIFSSLFFAFLCELSSR